LAGLVRTIAVVLLMCGLSFVAGCGGAGPQTKVFPVKGVVRYQDGRPFGRAMIDFRSQDPHGLSVNGEIGPEGRFTLRTVHDAGAVQGAPAGTYAAIIMPRLDGDQTQRLGPPAIRLPGPFVVPVGGSDSLTITVESDAAN
jgi:hypothetical protein